MTFTSPLFLVFLIFAVSINYALPQRFRHLFLILCSFVFIGFYNIESLLAVLVFSLFNFFLAQSVKGNRFLFLVGLFVNAGAILLFNYFNTATNGFVFTFSSIHFNLDCFIIALGLSFYSLQNIAFLTEVYYERIKTENSLYNFILYTSFFPKVISGPVMLPAEFFPQINRNSITKTELTIGFQRFLTGLFKKMVIADRLAPAVSSVYDYPTSYSGMTVLAATYLFTIQLYFDFSGYTDMALGIAKMLGYDLKENFDTPLRSTSVSEFWRRWHISLISWFTQYIYYPVVYKLRSFKKTAALVGILFTFFVSGIWHGIGLTFTLWALCHAVYLSFELFTKGIRVKLSERLSGIGYKLISAFIVFNAICFSNIFFRAASAEKAFALIRSVFTSFVPQQWLSGFIAPLAIGGHQADEFNLYISVFLFSVFLLFENRLNKMAKSAHYRIPYIVILLMLIMLFGVFANGARFIYMQF